MILCLLLRAFSLEKPTLDFLEYPFQKKYAISICKYETYNIKIRFTR